jgi:hypothetical protein
VGQDSKGVLSIEHASGCFLNAIPFIMCAGGVAPVEGTLWEFVHMGWGM